MKIHVAFHDEPFLSQSLEELGQIEIEYVSDKLLISADPAASQFVQIFQRFSTAEALTSQKV
jgi:hypothetical protein